MPLINIKDIDPSILSAAEFRQYKACCAAIWALRHESDVHYAQIRTREQYAQLKPPPYVPTVFDCVFFVIYCFHCGGAPDPFESGYSAIGTTNNLFQHGTLIGGPTVREGMLRPGDVTFEGYSGNDITHVCFYIGDGMVISHGQEKGPLHRGFRGVTGAAPLVAVKRFPF